MRVLMLGWEFPPHISGGLGTACQGLIEGLSQQGVEVLLVLPRATGDEQASGAEIVGCATGPHVAVETVAVPSTLTPYARPVHAAGPGTPAQRVAAARRAWGGRIRAVAAHVEGEDPAGTGADVALTGGYGPDLLAEVERYAHAVARVVVDQSFDVVHAHDWMTVPAGVAAARARGVPLVLHVHASEHDRSREAPDPDVLALEQIGLDEAARVVCVSRYTARGLQAQYRVDAARLRVVHNAVAPPVPRSEPAAPRVVEEPVVLFLGRVTGQKGPSYFLEAAAHVLRIRPEVKFVMAGAGDMLPAMVELSAHLGIARSVHFTGFLRGTEVERMFAGADVLVMPSVSEPFGIVPLEAMAQDVPVIVSRQSGVSEVLTHALKVDFWDIEELANKILALLERPKLRRSLIAEGRDEVDGLRWETRGAELKSVYEDVLA